MHLKSIEIFGFKSFPEKTVLKLESGINVVVGPNGCGKSNVFDAVKWAMGEQSPKSLRGAKMEDVIFNGTQTHPAVNYSELTLTFCNEDGYLPVDYKEVAVGRKLFRSGESEYYLNKTQVRLKDIEELFMGTGIGESTYSFVEQGKIEIFLSYKPEDKRLIFDEASGIVKYKERKREALRKLKDTDENILRLDDIIAEVRRQIRYLERQVEKARKYKDINEKLVVAEKSIAAINIRNLDNQLNAVLDELNIAKEQEANKENDFRTTSEQASASGAKLDALRREMEQFNADIISSNSRIDAHTNHIQINQQRIEEFDTRIINLDKNSQELDRRLKLHTTRIEEEEKNFASLSENLNRIVGVVEDSKKKIDDSSATIKEQKTCIDSAKKVILESEGKRTEYSNMLIELNTRIQNLSARKRRLALDQAKTQNHLAQRQEKFQEVGAKEEEVLTRLGSLKEERSGFSSRIKTIDVSLDKLEHDRIEHEKSIVELNSYFQFLKELKIKYDQFPTNKKIRIIFHEEPKEITTLIASLKGVTLSQVQEGGELHYAADVEAKIVSLKDWELKEKIDILQKEVEEITQKIQGLQGEKTQNSQELIGMDEKIVDQEKSLSQMRQEKQIFQQELARFQEELDILTSELEGATKEINDYQGRQKRLQEDIGTVKGELTQAQTIIDAAQNILNTSQEAIRTLEIEITRRETELHGFDEQKEAYLSKITLLSEEKDNLSRTIAGVKEEKELSTGRIQSLREEVASLEAKITQEKEALDDLATKKNTLSQNEAVLRKEVEAHSLQLDEVNKQLEKIRSDVYNRKLDAQKIEFDKSKITDYLKQVYNTEVDAQEVAESIQPLADLCEERDKLKKRIESLGEVSLVAIEEFEELNKRFEFLEQQKEDLLTAKDELKKAIQKINRTSKDIFLETFNKIQDEFKKLFRFLFGGGRANLILIDQDNILESGVEIEVQPPGKKLQNVSLLSGGEKALTAISLIFAIFRVNPSPLCVLDEIDAPLDEANVDRFNSLLAEFSKNSQYVIITHNKKTMSNADVLYGVTMQEKGISKLVSVKFAEEKMSAQGEAAA